jgi:hypothetical protein
MSSFLPKASDICVRFGYVQRFDINENLRRTSAASGNSTEQGTKAGHGLYCVVQLCSQVSFPKMRFQILLTLGLHYFALLAVLMCLDDRRRVRNRIHATSGMYTPHRVLRTAWDVNLNVQGKQFTWLSVYIVHLGPSRSTKRFTSPSAAKGRIETKSTSHIYVAPSSNS